MHNRPPMSFVEHSPDVTAVNGQFVLTRTWWLRSWRDELKVVMTRPLNTATEDVDPATGEAQTTVRLLKGLWRGTTVQADGRTAGKHTGLLMRGVVFTAIGEDLDSIPDVIPDLCGHTMARLTIGAVRNILTSLAHARAQSEEEYQAERARLGADRMESAIRSGLPGFPSTADRAEARPVG